MAITVADLRFYTAERMTDEDDGGGQMAATEIVSGEDNQIFDDLSDVDRAAGDVSLRKVYAAVRSQDTDKYLDAGVIVFREPADENVSVTAFSTGSFYDERLDLQTRLEQSVVRGARWPGWLWGPHLTGMRAIVLWQRPETELPSVGARLELVAVSNGVEQHSQFLWITQVTDQLRTIIDSNGPFQVREVVGELAEALTANYTGPEPTRTDPATASLAGLVYDTRYNAEAVPLFGIRPTVADAQTGDYSIQIDSLYTPIIPTALTETALPDVTPGGDSPALIGSNSTTISFTTTTQSIKPNVALYCGTGILPGTLSISVSGATITDDNGEAKLTGTVIGAVDYGNGIITWTDTCPNYTTASKTVTFKPAARPLTIAESAAMPVTVENRGYVWVMTLTPIPAPGTLKVSYRVNDKWYTITDQGGGLIKGVDSAYGAGQLNFITGTVTFTAGALPDVESEIIYAWSVPTQFFERGGSTSDAPVIRGQTEHAGVAPNTVTLSWTVGNDTFEATDLVGDGNLNGAGDGDGYIEYSTGAWWFRPAVLPPQGTEFTLSYQYGAGITETFIDPAAVGGLITLNLANTNVLPRTVSVQMPVKVTGFANQANLPENMIATDAELETRTVFAEDDGNDPLGDLWVRGIVTSMGSAAYAAGLVTILDRITLSTNKPTYSSIVTGFKLIEDVEVPVFRAQQTGWSTLSAEAAFDGGTITVNYRTSNSLTSVEETVVLEQLEFDLTRGYSEQIVSGSVAFTIGTSRYVDTAGQVYRDPSPLTGAGTLCGSVDRSAGVVRFTSWPSGGANAVTIQSLLTQASFHPIEEVVFRAPISPIRAGSLQLRATTLDGVALSKTVDGSGNLEDNDCTIDVDYPRGIIRARFGAWKLDSGLTNEEKLEPWYDPDSRVDFSGILKIWKPKLVVADSIVYNAVAQTLLPPDSNLLGLNAARLPPDGRALIFNTGRLVLVHHTDTFTENSLSPSQDLNCGRVRLYRAVIDDVDGQRLPADFFTVNRETGHVVMSPALDLTGYTGPYTIRHTVADLARLVSVDINGTLALNKPLSHDYPQDDSRVSGMLYIGTLQARVSNVFAQSTWTSVWSDELIGNEPLAQYNDTLYPILVTNEGAYPDRMLVKFTSATAFQVIGENLGLIATGNINEDCAPTNLLTGKTYFTIQYEGWGAGWSTGNCLRFNVVGAAYPVDLIRATQPSDPSGADDSVELLLVGNIDA